MTGSAVNWTITVDVSALLVVASGATALLGLFLILAWVQDRVRALAWWGCAYLLGGFAIAIWNVETLIASPLPTGFANALLFVSCGMIWSAARLFYGRPVLWSALMAGAVAWLAASMVPAFAQWTTIRILLSSLIVASYSFLISAELWRERRRQPFGRLPAVFVPILHFAIFLSPIPLASLLPSGGNITNIASGWMMVAVLGTVFYVVGTAFIGLAIAKERAIRIHRDAASLDELTGLLNRRGFLHAAQSLVARQTKLRKPASVLMCDLDNFKSINDRFGHVVGDAALSLFGATASTSTRTTDVVGRLGGEEFAIILPGPIEDASVVANRLRGRFETEGVSVADCNLNATVSIGIATGLPGTDVMTLLARADTALYRAKKKGRNRIEVAEDAPAIPQPVPLAVSDRHVRQNAPVQAPPLQRVS